MKKLLALLLAASVGYAIASFVATQRDQSRVADYAQREALWLAEKSHLEAELAAARRRPVAAPLVSATRPSPDSAGASKPLSPAQAASAKDLLARLTALGIEASTNQNRHYRQLIAQLENLAALGPAAIPAIRDFLRQNQDAVFASEGPPPGRGPKWKQDSALPASLRSGLIDTLKRIGGPEAEQLLTETLSSTGRGYEVLTIARALEEMAPGKYRDTVLATAQSLIANPPAADPASRLDQQSQSYLYDVLRQYGDATTFAQVGGQLLTANGTVNEAALSLLEKVPANDSLPQVYQALQDPRLTDPKQREPLLEVAMNHVGADPQAGELFLAVMQSQDVSVQLQQKAIRHLAGEGLENEDAPTARDLQVLQSRLQYLDAVKPALTDPKLAVEWDKTRARIAGRLAPAQPKTP